MPNPGTQEYLISSPADITCVLGNRGGSKSVGLLWNFYRDCNSGYGDQHVGIVVGYERASLNNIIRESIRWFTAIPGAKFNASELKLGWKFPCGAELFFKFCSNDKMYSNKIHGSSYSWIAIEEVCTFPEEELVNKIFSTLRADPNILSEKTGLPLHCRSLLIGNPNGRGSGWVKRRYVDPAPYGVPVYETFEVDKAGCPGETEKVEYMTITMFAPNHENLHMSAAARANLERQTRGNPMLHAAWVEGKFSPASEVSALADVWLPEVHEVPRFKVPHSWYVDRAYDHGVRAPSFCGWFAQSDGTEITMEDGTVRSWPVGTLFLINEYHTHTDIYKNEGDGRSARQIAIDILQMEKDMVEQGWLEKIPNPGPADNSIATVSDKLTKTVKDLMSEAGCHWERSDKSPNSRQIGYQLLRDRLVSATDPDQEEPAFYVMNNNRAWLALVPWIELKDDGRKNDMSNKCNAAHAADMTRYRVLKDKPSKIEALGSWIF